MKRLSLLAGLALAAMATPAAADHRNNLETDYASKGECQAATNAFTMNDRDFLLGMFPNFYESQGDVTSVLIMAFPCEYNEEAGAWRINNDLTPVLSSEWYLRRH